MEHVPESAIMRAVFVAVVLSLALGCGDDSTPSQSPTNVDPGKTDPTGTEPTDPIVDDRTPLEGETEKPPPAIDPKEWYTVEAGPFTVPAGTERFLCFTTTLDEDLVVSEVALDSKPVVHHVVFSRTTAPDPDGMFECDVLFKNNWIPLFVAGTGDASLPMPDGAGYILEKGTQLTTQLHLLNTGTEDLTETVPIRLRRMETPEPEPVEVVVFGSMAIDLPPGEKSDVVGTCKSDSDMTLFAAFPHMHLLGRSMVVETGPDEDNLTEIFRRDPYDFDDQRLEEIAVTIKQGDTVRVRCGYENTLDQNVTFGESSNAEMCFFIGFATEAGFPLAGCIGGAGGASGFIPETCGDDPPNDLGLGAGCTKGGNECTNGFICTEDFDQISGPEICLGFSCETSADCGEGGICCGVAAAGGLTICVPPSCLFSACNPLD